MNATVAPISLKRHLLGTRHLSPSERTECDRVYSEALTILYNEGINAARQYVEKELDTCTDAYMA